MSNSRTACPAGCSPTTRSVPQPTPCRARPATQPAPRRTPYPCPALRSEDPVNYLSEDEGSLCSSTDEDSELLRDDVGETLTPPPSEVCVRLNAPIYLIYSFPLKKKGRIVLKNKAANSRYGGHVFSNMYFKHCILHVFFSFVRGQGLYAVILILIRGGNNSGLPLDRMMGLPGLPGQIFAQFEEISMTCG